MRLFCGGARPEAERLLTDSPDMLHVGCQHFAAQPYDWVKLGRVVARGAVGLFPIWLRSTWSDSSIPRSS